MVPDPDYRETTVTVSPGDILVLQTDGLVEAQDHGKRLYGEERLFTILRAANIQALTSRQIIGALLDDVRKFTGTAPQHDDMTVVVVRIL
jgi:sigma-B regulation protein RsbU (phosphoserine phosphatase)